MKKLKKLVLKKETVANLSDFEQNRLKGGKDTWDYFNEYIALITSHYDPVACALGYANSDYSFCACDRNATKTCNTACDDTDILPGGCNYTRDLEICRTE